ncbi:hypothetical protein [Paraburkholderia sp. GAS42]|jgi:hypothetical protein|uniref:hypothetical protein n=1 Tax=Paraburkholderia sp. GAS42 TaxID=3035135 RepID=UPI003D1CD057
MSRILRLGLSGTVAVAVLCLATTVALGARAQRPPDTIPSQLLSDDERVDFCAQMQRASTQAERQAVLRSLRDTLTPRASAQDVALPSWLLDARGASVPGGAGDSIPGLGCTQRSTRPAAPAATPAPARDAPVRGAAAASPASARNTPVADAPVPKTPVNEAPISATAAPDATRNGVPVGHDRGVDYVTGGVGQDEAAALRQLAPSYNMRATFTLGNGEYLSGVGVQVSRPDGTVVLAARSEGPYLFARLPSGRYRVVATVDGVARSRELYVPSRGSVRFTLTWPHASTSAR